MLVLALLVPATASASVASDSRALTRAAPGRRIVPIDLPQLSSAVVALADGKVVAAGSTPSGKLQTAQLTADGTPDRARGTGGSTALAPEQYGEVLLPAPAGATLLAGLRTPVEGTGEARAQIARIARDGQLEPAAGGASTTQLLLPFGGGEVHPGEIADLRLTGFGSGYAHGVIQRPDGTLLIYGDVGAAEVRLTSGGGEGISSARGLGIAAPNRSFELDRGFGGPSSLQLTARVASTRLRSTGIAVRLPLTRAGRRLLRGQKRLRVTVHAAIADLARNRLTVTTTGGLKR